MKQDIFALYRFDNYRAFLKYFLKEKNRNQRGAVGQLALNLGVNSAMVSQILHEKAHLSAEQALRLTKYFGFSKMETEYFMALVGMNRAGDNETKKYYSEKVLNLAELGQTLKEQLNYQDSKTPLNEYIYYSHWYYCAAWLLTAIKPQTLESFCNLLNLSEQALAPVLTFLVEAGMLENTLGTYSFKGVHIHTGKNSEHLLQHHINWRLKAIQTLQSEGANKNFHFTGAIVLSKDDVAKVNERILEFLKDFREISGPSACEELLCLNVDWFKITSANRK